MTNTAATSRQRDALEIAARRAGFRDPQLALAAVAGTESKNWRYDLTKVDASAVLDALAGGLTPETVAAPAIAATSGGNWPSKDEAETMRGNVVTVTLHSGNEVTGRVLDIVASKLDDSPALSIEGDAKDDGSPAVRRLSLITSWRIHPAEAETTRSALEAERAELLARLAEIDALLSTAGA